MRKSRLLRLLFVPLLMLFLYVAAGFVLIRLLGIDSIPATVIVDSLIAVLCGVYVHRCEPCVRGDGKSLTGIPMKYMMWPMLVLVWVFGQITSAYVLEATGDASYRLYQSTIGQNASLWLSVLLTVVVAPICEEMMLRGFVQDRWSRINPWFGILGSTALFAMMHGTLVHLPSTFMLGLMAAVVYASTGRIWLSVALHSGYNCAAAFLGRMSIPDILFEPVVFGVIDVALVVWMLCEYRHAMVSGSKGARDGEAETEIDVEETSR